jgi:hypothetical protein
MKFAVIAPIPHLQDLAVRSDYHLVLAHLCLESREYLRFYQERREAGDFLMLDNGVIEKGSPIKEIEMALVIRELKPHEVVLPDFLFDSERTYKATKHAWGDPDFRDPCDAASARFMIVPQGTTHSEWCESLEALMNLTHGEVHAIGIPKKAAMIAYQGAKTGRRSLALFAHEHYPGYAQHYLGLWCSPIELQFAPEFVRGCDSVLPVVAAIHHVELSSRYGLIVRPDDWHFDPYARFEDRAGVLQALYNISVVKTIAAHRSGS